MQGRTIPAEVADAGRLETADFNRDGKPDLALISGSGIAVRLGNGNGTFQRPLSSFPITTGGVFTSIVADVNNDMTPDVLTGDYAGTVTVALGNGNGMFRAGPGFAVGGERIGIVPGDFNGDRRADLAVASYGANSTFVLLGNGDGTFRQAFRIAAGPLLSIGDLNGDSRLDLLVAVAEAPAGESGMPATVYFGNGDGTFQTSPRYMTNVHRGAHEIADVNGDGRNDLIVLGLESSILLGNGDGTFRQARALGISVQIPRLAVGHFDRDRNIDVAVSDYGRADGSQPALFLLFGNGDGTFRPSLNLATEPFPESVGAADFNLDGSLDIVILNNLSGPRRSLTTVLDVGRQVAAPYELSARSIVNSASFLPGAISPGELITILDVPIGPARTQRALPDNNGTLATSLSGVRVLLNGVAAPVLHVAYNRIDAVVPYSLVPGTSARVEVELQGQLSAPMIVGVAAAMPGIFTEAHTFGAGQAAAINQDGVANGLESIINPADGSLAVLRRPAKRGAVIAFFVTGVGPVTPPNADGRIVSSPLPAPTLPVVAGINHAGAEILFIGAAPGQIAGVYQVNVRIPEDAPVGFVPVSLRVGDAYTQPEVRITIE